MRFTQERLKSSAVSSAIQDWRDLAVEEWLQGAAAVREKVHLIDSLKTYQEAFAGQEMALKALQLPFDEKAHWIAVEFPAVSPEQLDDQDKFVFRQAIFCRWCGSCPRLIAFQLRRRVY